MKTEYEMGGQRSAKELAKQGHTAPVYGIGQPVPRSRQRYYNQIAKGGPYSRCTVIDVKPSKVHGIPATFRLLHPTSKNGRYRKVKATPEIIRSRMPSALPQQVNALLGF